MKSWFSRCTTGIFYKKTHDNKEGLLIAERVHENEEDYIRLYDEIWDL